MQFATFNFLALLPLATAHFRLDWPTNRGFDPAKAGDFPCGGFNDMKTPRTQFPLNGAPIQLNMEHTQTNIAVYMAVGNSASDLSFSTVLRPQMSQEGLGDFCMGKLSIPSGMNITAGTNATIQVVTNGHSGGGLYQCADVTFVNTTLSESQYNDNCKNNTGVKVTAENQQGNPNGTSGSGTSSGSSGGSSPPPSAAGQTSVTSWLLAAVGVAGFALL